MKKMMKRGAALALLALALALAACSGKGSGGGTCDAAGGCNAGYGLVAKK